VFEVGRKTTLMTAVSKDFLTVGTALFNFQNEEQFLHTNAERSRGFHSVAASVLSVIRQRLLEFTATTNIVLTLSF